MGGMGSGRQRSTQIGNVEGVLALDIRALRRLGVIVPGECVIDTLRWSIDGLSMSCVRLRADLSDIERGGTLILRGDMPDGAISQNLAIEALPSSFGGWRCYFTCPVTARRCEVLYYAGGRFASREAQRLSYAVQNMTGLTRARRKAAKLRSRLQGTNSLHRPRGRNRIDMVERLRDAEFETKTAYHDRLCGLTGGSAIRQMPGGKRGRVRDS
ncbi:MAG: hypothetical protein LBV50_07135 [Novosphingobium sp.]|jgi:hypothetical protein|nr:hypothetical protein [Novosphingobium sp.]